MAARLPNTGRGNLRAASAQVTDSLGSCGASAPSRGAVLSGFAGDRRTASRISSRSGGSKLQRHRIGKGTFYEHIAMSYLRLIWMSLFRRKARTFFTLLSIAVAFLLFGLLDCVR